jgi:hypothetical protein
LENRPEIPGKFLNMVLEKKEIILTDRVKRRRSAAQSQGENKSATDNTKTKG